MRSIRLAVALAAAISLCACAALPRERGYADARSLVKSASGILPPPPHLLVPAPIPDRPVTAADAARLALLHHPRVRKAFTQIGMARGAWQDAARIGNPSFSFLSLAPGGGDSTITRALGISLSDAILMPARRRLATGELKSAQWLAAAELLDLAYDAERAWFEAAGAAQIAAMRALVARAANASEALAQRFFDAGNISRLELELERAAAAQARIDAIDASAHALRTRATLAGFIGQRASGHWSIASALPAPLAGIPDVDALMERALEQRLDLRAARQALALAEDALDVTQRWRWLGAVEIGAERERESSGERLRGPSVAVELPLFNQGQGSMERARAELHQARALLDGLALGVHNEAATAIDTLNAARDIAERYAKELVPRREAIVARTQEQVNFMLLGVFDLLLAKQQEFDAYQSYLESVRDYWIARSALRRAIGGRLPDDDAIPTATLDVDAMLPTSPSSKSHHGRDATEMNPEGDPHRGHDRPEIESAIDPHAAHDKLRPKPRDPPNADRSSTNSSEKKHDRNPQSGEAP